MGKGKKINIDREFSPQELQIIRELLKEPTCKEIADNLDISDKTVRYHIDNITGRLGLKSKEELRAFFKQRQSANGKTSDDPLKFSNLYNQKYLKVLVAVCFAAVLFYSCNMEKPPRESSVMNIEIYSDHFLNRPFITEQVVSVLKKQEGIQTVVITGLGGAGKTTLARKLLSSLKKSIKLEINAETEESTFNSFFELADYISHSVEQKRELGIIRNLQDQEVKKRHLVRFVAGILKRSSDWCLLFDNVSVLDKVRRYLPINSECWGEGSLIITTRNEDLKNTNFIRSDWVIDIGELTESEKKELFSNILYSSNFTALDTERRLAIEMFLKNIPALPLDVCATAYYLKNTKISFADYERLMKDSYRELDSEQGALLKENANYGRTRYGIVSSVFKEILKEDDRFKHLLLITVLLDSQNIPKTVLRNSSCAIVANKFVQVLRKHSLITDAENTVSIHRISQHIGYNFTLERLSAKEKEEIVNNLTNAVTPYQKLESEISDVTKIVPHIEAILEKISKEEWKDVHIERSKIALLILMGDIFRHKSHRVEDSLRCFQKALEINSRFNCLNKTELAITKLKIGEVYSLMNRNTEAKLYLSSSFCYLPYNSMEQVKNCRLLGITEMRNYKFEEANEYFTSALNILKKRAEKGLAEMVSESNIYSDIAFNYFMDGINRKNAEKAVPIMRKAIEVLEEFKNSSNFHKVIDRLAIHKIKLAGIYNALGKYDTALSLANETEELINTSKLDSNDIFYVKGIIARERGLSNLRLNNVGKAYKYFMEAKEIFTKSMTGDYLFKIKMHESECLIRLNRFREAMQTCENMFAEEERERNNYSDLFFNTCYYHAAVITYKTRKTEASIVYFKKFFQLMKVFCYKILPEEDYKKLVSENVFEVNYKNVKNYFVNALKIFEAIYWKDYEFTKYYVEENLKFL